jgi:hypothetical protein
MVVKFHDFCVGLVLRERLPKLLGAIVKAFTLGAKPGHQPHRDRVSNTDCHTPRNTLQICFTSVTTQYVAASYRFDLGGRRLF